MANAELSLSADGLKQLKEDEAEIDGLYDDPSGYCTFGVGHLVHQSDKWGCFLLSSVTGDPWKGYVDKKWPGKPYETSYLKRTTAFAEKFSDLKTQAVETAKPVIAQKKYGKEFAKLTAAEQTTATELAKAAVDEQARLLAKTTDDVLKEDVKPFEKSVRDNVAVTLTQTEFDALISLCFNIGATNFSKSGVVKEINKDQHKAGDAKQREAAIKAIEDAFALWNKSGGVTLDGLTKRRKRESDRFLESARAALAELKKAPAAGAPAAVGAPPKVTGASLVKP